jgi:hypothetical protein
LWRKNSEPVSLAEICSASDRRSFRSRNFSFGGRLNTYEKVRQNPLFSFHGDDLHDWVCGRSTCVQKERQELPHE